ncbi:MAG: VWA domain-containing protein, partial [Candidatus Margulisiibacteriota bacterium]
MSNTHVDGVGIMLLMDLSGSMEAEDFLPKNRITVSKKVIQDFIHRRVDDLLGLVVFGSDAFLVSPLSSDHRLLLEQIAALSIGQIDGKTAIGTAIVKGANHLRDVHVKSKVMILLTDGENNSGDIDPVTAAHLTAALGIKVYSIGIGKPGGAPIPVIHPVYGKVYARNPDGSLVLSKLDEETLKKIAGITGGLYFRAVDTVSLQSVYSYIDQMEKTKVEVKRFVKRESRAMPFLWAGAVALICYVLLEFLIFRVAR